MAALLLTVAPLAAGAQEQRSMTVSELFRLVETGSSTLTARKGAIEVAARGMDEARSSRLPDINAQLSAAYNGNVLMLDRNMTHAHGLSQPHISNSFSLEASQVVYAGGAVNAGIRLADIQQRQAETAADITRSDERLKALGQYLDLFRIDNSIRVYESNITLTEKLVADIKARQAQGMALKNDVTRYELQLETLRLALRKLHDSRDVLNHQLTTTLGLKDVTIVPDRRVADEPAGNPTGDSTADGSEAEWQQRAALSSPRLRSAALAVDAATEQLNITRSRMRPSITLFAADNFNGPFIYDLPPINKNFNLWYIGVGIRYSLSSLFKGNKSVNRARASVAMSRLEKATAAEAVDNAMNEATTLYRQSFAELRTRRKSVELAADNYRIVNDRYLAQMALVTDMVDASNLKLDAELQEVNARTAIVFAWYRMKYIAGEI